MSLISILCRINIYIYIYKQSMTFMLKFVIVRLTGWQVDRLTGRQFNRSTHWQVDRLRDREVDRSTGWQVDRSTGWQIEGWQVDRSTSLQVDRWTGRQVSRLTGRQVDRSPPLGETWEFGPHKAAVIGVRLGYSSLIVLSSLSLFHTYPKIR